MDPAFRAAVLSRDRHQCQASILGYPNTCEGPLHAHHRVGVTKIDELWNVTTLCLGCHGHIHNHPALAHCYGFIIPRWYTGLGQFEETTIVLQLDELVRRLKLWRTWFGYPPRAPWVRQEDLDDASVFDDSWLGAVPL
jgi:hypothetical protein